MRAYAYVAALLLAAAAPTAVRAQLAQDTPSKTAAGTSVTAPKDWTLTAGPVAVLAAPEGDARVMIVDVGAARDADEAAAKAWGQAQPGFARPVKLLTPRAPREGWAERAVVDYETSPNEKRLVTAVAQRAGDRWTVLLLDAAEATFNKRSAAFSLVQNSLRPAGFVRESFVGRTAAPLDAARVATMRAFVEQSMRELGIPGASVALIADGRVVSSFGLGVRELGKPDPVTADTRMMVASNTKGMSTLMLATLADKGKLRWDQPVTQAYPAFRLGNDDTTRRVQMRHLVCACTGLPRKDLEWILNTRADTPASDTFRQLAATQPTSDFGALFQYNNLITSAGGFIGGALAHPGMEVGAAYDRAMKERVFGPLRMTNTVFDEREAMRGDFAMGHAMNLDGRVVVLQWPFVNRAIHPYRPAGGAWSTANDMAKYVQLELSRGLLPDGRRLVSEANLLKRRERGVQVGEDRWYGMGLEEMLMGGVGVIHHGGSMLGYKSDWFAIPSANVGAVILTNSEEGGYLLQPFARRLVELLYDGRPEAAATVTAAAARVRGELAKERERWNTPVAPAAAALLSAAYASPELGRMTIRRDGADAFLVLKDGPQRLGSRVNADGTTSFASVSPELQGLELVAGANGGKPALILRDAQHEYRLEPVR